MDSRMFEKELEDILDKKSLPELFDFMEKNIVLFFSTPDIPKYYQILKNVDFLVSEKPTPKVMMAWMAFLSGEYVTMFSLLQDICETDFTSPQESSMFYTLKAMVENIMDSNEGAKYARVALDILPEEKEDFFLANAKLTSGQLLASSNQYRSAAEMFRASYKIFYSLGLSFLAVVAMVNELLNRYKLGEFSSVIDKCNEGLMMGASFKDEMETYWQAIHLPLGMCYYELNKPYLAIEHLQLAKKTIDQFGLFHMHGLIELYLFKSYYIINDKSAMERLKEETIAKFEHMHYRQTDMLISMFKIFLLRKTQEHLIQPDIEKLELEYLKNGANSHSIAMEALVFLQVEGVINMIKISDLERRLERLKYSGFIPQVQLTLLRLAELYYREECPTEAINYLKEAVEVYKEFGISACFHSLSPGLIVLMKKVDMSLYNNILSEDKQKNISTRLTTLLTAKEKEIVKLIAQGKTNNEMSQILFISVGTIKWHINNIFGKLGVKNRVQAIAKAKNLGEI